MIRNMHLPIHSKLARRLIVVYVLLTLAYLYLAVALPSNQEKISSFGLSPLNARLVSLSLAIPLSLIWIVAIIGFVTLFNYSKVISEQPDGRALRLIAFGSLFLAIQSPVRTLIRSLMSCLVVYHPSWQHYVTPTSTYLNLILFGIAFVCISRGAHALADLVNLRPSLLTYHLLIIGFTTVGVLYSLATFIPHSLGHFDLFTSYHDFHLPLFVTVFTIVIPSLYLWFVALFAAYEMFSYQQKVRGLLYRQALRFLSIGIATVTIDAIFIQFVTTSSDKINHFNINTVIIFAYLTLFVLAVGFAMIARGARRLRKLEEI